MTTEQPATPKKAGRPRKTLAPYEWPGDPAPRVHPTPQESPFPESKPEVGTQVPAKPEIATQSLPTITVEELVEGMDRDLVQRVDVALARHMVKDHRMTWGEVRVSMGYGTAKQDPQQDQLWDAVYRQAQA